MSYISPTKQRQVLARRSVQRNSNERTRINMLDQFRSFTIDRLDIDELVSLAAYGRGLRQEYLDLKLDVPQWVEENLKTLTREISNRVADQRAAKKQQIIASINALKTPTEKREELKAQLEALEAVGA